MSFDGRSHNLYPLRYSFRERVQMRLATKLMPAISPWLFSDRLNTLAWKALGASVGRHSIIRVGTHINAPFMVAIGHHSEIHGRLLSRGGIRIGDGVELVEDVFVSTQTHNMRSAHFEPLYAEVVFENYAWVGPRSTVLAGSHLAEGSVVAAGAMLKLESTEPWTMYGGVPAKVIGHRTPLLVGAT
jgi:putative colanic acid biosynthesis acetyltransferase WcaF